MATRHQDNYQDLIKEVSACRLCQGLPLGPRPIFQLHPRARILIAGQAPGRVTHGRGRPFDDPSGRRLRDWLGVGEERFYDPACFAILPMGMCYPGTGAQGDLPPRPVCAETWRHRLLAALPSLQLTLIVGRHALAWHMPEQRGATLTHTVERWRDYWPARLPLPHPSPRNNRWLGRNPIFETQIVPKLRQRVQELLAGR